MLDADLSSNALVRILTGRGCDVLAAGQVDRLKQLDDAILFAVAQEEGRILVTHNARDFTAILREWADAARSHHGCVLSFLPTNAYAELERRFARWFELFPAQGEWVDRAVVL